MVVALSARYWHCGVAKAALRPGMQGKVDRWLFGENGPTALKEALFRAGTSFPKSTLTRPERLFRSSSRIRGNDASNRVL